MCTFSLSLDAMGESCNAAKNPGGATMDRTNFDCHEQQRIGQIDSA
jgi:hypothetical protein